MLLKSISGLKVWLNSFYPQSVYVSLKQINLKFLKHIAPSHII